MKNKVPILAVRFFNGIHAFQSNQGKCPGTSGINIKEERNSSHPLVSLLD